MISELSDLYNKWEHLGLKITFVLVSLQIIHLYWLTTFVIFEEPQFTLGIPPVIFAVIDYLEVPALISGTVFYIFSIIKDKSGGKNVILLGLLIIQFIHIVWITDTFVYMSFQFNHMVYLAWFAILIDYAEVVVLYDLFRKLYASRKREVSDDCDLSFR